jgi:hypothetical protein
VDFEFRNQESQIKIGKPELNGFVKIRTSPSLAGGDKAEGDN